MSTKLRFTSATVTHLVLAKVGHPQRDEPLQTSKQVLVVNEADQETLTALFLKPFKNLAGHRFSHSGSLDLHPMNTLSKAAFETPGDLLAIGCEIAKRLYEKSNHPNIKSGDLCIALVEGIQANADVVSALCLLKAESVVPFLSISNNDGDLQLHTEQGINPDKLDKGCLILNHLAPKGHFVLTFDRTGTDSRFWVRDFLGLVPITDSPFLTKGFTDMAVAFATQEAKDRQATAETEDAPPWDTGSAARDALAFFDGKEKFSLQEYEEQVLRTPDAVSKFQQHRAKVEAEMGQRFDNQFDISKKDVTKAKKRITTVMKLDTGVEIHVRPAFANQPEPMLERGFDEAKGMKFIKVYFNKDVSV
jgi:hypothetical protein